MFQFYLDVTLTLYFDLDTEMTLNFEASFGGIEIYIEVIIRQFGPMTLVLKFDLDVVKMFLCSK